MLVSTRHKRLILNLKDPARVTGLVPDHKLIDYKGATLVAVPHDLETAVLLRGLGLDAPSPIEHYYDWPGRWAPFKHQRHTASFCTLNKRAFVLNGMGSGKTMSALWAADYMLKASIVDWVYVLSPLSTLERAWGDELFRNFSERTWAVLHGTAERRMRLLEQQRDIYIINHDGIKNPRILQAMATRPGRGLVIVDELSTYRNASTERWKAANALINGDKKRKFPGIQWAWGMTGTPAPKDPTNVWAQAKLIKPANVPSFYGTFRDYTMRQVGPYKWVPRPEGWDRAAAALAPAIRYSREECIDLPPTTHVTREVELSPEQSKMYREMLTRLKTEYEQGTLTAVNAAVQQGKLLQIVCGVAYTPAGEVEIPSAPRLEELVEVIEQASAKVIVFVPITGALNMVARHLREQGYAVGVVHGGVSKTQRDELFADFQNPNGIDVIVANPGTMSHGLSLVAADTIVWYAPCNNAETEQQANARIVRPGQVLNTLIVRLSGSPLERKMYARLDGNEDAQNVLLEMFE